MVNFSDLSQDEQILFYYQISNDLIIAMLSTICDMPEEIIHTYVLNEVEIKIDMKTKKTLKGW